MEEETTTVEVLDPQPIAPEEVQQPGSPEDMLPGDDIGFTKEEVAALAEPVAKGQYTAKFHSLKKNIFKDEATGEEKFLGYVHSAKKSGAKKIIPTFMLISDDPMVNNRPISAHVTTSMRLFAQIDKQLDLLTGTRIDPAKVENAKDKVVILSVGYEAESTDKDTGKTFPAKNSIQAVLPYKG